jgi:endogenous inhibitor of DNA gyrase (YacG/DUF329 family)
MAKYRKKIMCPLCGLPVTGSALRAHKVEFHGEAAPSARLTKPATTSKTQKKRQDELLVKCPHCPKKVKKREMAEHRRKKHPTKAQKLREIFGPDEETRRELAKRSVEVSGGGFGVGKRRK